MDNTPPPVRRRAFAIAMALVLLWPLTNAVRNGLSGIYARPAISYLEQKRFATDSFSKAQWHAIEKNVLQANSLMPGNPQYLEALGRLHQIHLSVFTDTLNMQEMNAHANAAQTYFAAAVASRPTWPYYWGNLALEHYRRGNVATDDFSVTLANAARFGPWKNDTQRLVLDLGSKSWEVLRPYGRRQFVLNAERSLHRQPENAVRIVRSNDGWPKVCAATTSIVDISLPHLRALCAQPPFAQTVE